LEAFEGEQSSRDNDQAGVRSADFSNQATRLPRDEIIDGLVTAQQAAQ
jgi:hypothetical protein